MVCTWLKSEDGQGMAEYGILVAFVSLAAVAIIRLIGPAVSEKFQSAIDAFELGE